MILLIKFIDIIELRSLMDEVTQTNTMRSLTGEGKNEYDRIIDDQSKTNEYNAERGRSI